MSTKLTLSLQKEVIEKAKEYADKKGHSLSEMVENYFKFIVGERIIKEENTISPKVRKLKGILKVEENFDYKEVLREELSNK